MVHIQGGAQSQSENAIDIVESLWRFNHKCTCICGVMRASMYSSNEWDFNKIKIILVFES